MESGKLRLSCTDDPIDDIASKGKLSVCLAAFIMSGKLPEIRQLYFDYIYAHLTTREEEIIEFNNSSFRLI